MNMTEEGGTHRSKMIADQDLKTNPARMTHDQNLKHSGGIVDVQVDGVLSPQNGEYSLKQSGKLKQDSQKHSIGSTKESN